MKFSKQLVVIILKMSACCEMELKTIIEDYTVKRAVLASWFASWDRLSIVLNSVCLSVFLCVSLQFILKNCMKYSYRKKRSELSAATVSDTVSTGMKWALDLMKYSKAEILIKNFLRLQHRLTEGLNFLVQLRKSPFFVCNPQMHFMTVVQGDEILRGSGND